MYDGSEFVLPDDAKLPIIDWAGNEYFVCFFCFHCLNVFSFWV
jgi:hypothetical protein